MPSSVSPSRTAWFQGVGLGSGTALARMGLAGAAAARTGVLVGKLVLAGNTRSRAVGRAGAAAFPLHAAARLAASKRSKMRCGRGGIEGEIGALKNKSLADQQFIIEAACRSRRCGPPISTRLGVRSVEICMGALVISGYHQRWSSTL